MYSEQEIIRRGKLDLLKTKGINPYPEKFELNTELKDFHHLEDGTKNISVAGRIVSIRKMGKICFFHIQDIYAKVQLVIKKENLGDTFETFFSIIDIGDFIGANGDVFTTKSGEKTLRVNKYFFLGKSLRPLPEKFHGLSNTELRYRQRYLDLIVNEDTRNKFILRSAMIKEIRKFLEEKSFIEVETPILQNIASGALAKPFITHHNSLDIPLYLRIAPETYLKRLIVGGFTKVFEFAKCFRNEGLSPHHLQEFTMVEGYAAYWNYEDTMHLIRELILNLLKNVIGTTEIKLSGQLINFDKTWRVVSFRELILEDANIDIDNFETADSLLIEIKNKNIDLDYENVENLGRGNLIDLLYKKVSRPKIIGPTFLVKHPIDLSPLARANDFEPSVTDRFQLVVNGAEIVNAYSELVSPDEQRERLEKQARLKKLGDEEAMQMDEDYLLTMEYGMPPISGWGFGIERLLQILTDSYNIKDCVLFPLTRSKDN